MEKSWEAQIDDLWAQAQNLNATINSSKLEDEEEDAIADQVKDYHLMIYRMKAGRQLRTKYLK